MINNVPLVLLILALIFCLLDALRIGCPSWTWGICIIFTLLFPHIQHRL